jgi:hypothetical protein
MLLAAVKNVEYPGAIKMCGLTQALCVGILAFHDK